MALEIRHLRVVVSIADHGTLGGAARSLGLAQPAVSSQLKRIEKLVGASLFTRGQGGVRTTAAGAQVVDRARQVLAEVDSLSGELESLVQAPGDVLRMGGLSAVAFTRFTARAAKQLRRPLDVRVDISTAELTDWLVGGEVDVIQAGVHVGYDDVPPPGFEQWTYLETEPFMVALGSDHPLTAMSELRLEDLAGEPWLLPRGRPDGSLPAFLDACRAAGFQPDGQVDPGALDYSTPWITEHGALAVTTAAGQPRLGVTVRPLRGNPISGRLVVRWNPQRISRDEIADIRDLLASSLVDQVAESSGWADWWSRYPEHRPVLSPDLAERLAPDW
ncbi:LysR family transcriptional regulator [Nocardioides bigeumensis]|uniref:LysR family transcriptional regulator n=1 Tax=Nocardioides bigeumensis TaxID=433657 RepID=A0ABN2YPZ8_9ACTN